jgi:nucleotide-binding universal stress UspA family protein
MFKRILLPTDGSALSRQAAVAGIRFARDNGAQVVALHVIPILHDDQLEAWMHHDPDFVEHRQALFDKFADEYLAYVAELAAAEQVPCTLEKARAAEAATGILKTAEDAGCDLIYMASHGWRNDKAQMLGSDTLKVLHQSKAAVLVHKPA